MDLKEFIVETISGIADATVDLQTKYNNEDILINPPAAKSGSSVYKPGSGNYVYRHVKDVDFDVALTVSSSTSAGGKAGVKVFSAEIGGSGDASKAKEQVSRVQFSIPIALKPTASEEENLEVRKANNAKSDEAINKKRGSSKGIV